MAMVQNVRPWLDHTALVGVVDAAAWWIDQEEDDFARGLLQAAAGDETGAAAWLALLDLNPPRGTGEPSEHLPS
jgi:hypothetical protein